MFKALSLALSLCAVFVLPVPAHANAPEPEVATLAEAVANALPSGWRVEDLEVVVQINDGDAIDPRWRLRFEAELELSATLYQADREASDSLRPFIVLIETQAAGATRQLYGTARAQFMGGQWEIDVALENPPDRVGRLRDLFEGPTVLAGSDEVDAVLARLDAAETLASEIEAERAARRIAREAELKSLMAAQEAAEAAVISAHDTGLERMTLRLEATEAEMETRQSQAMAELETALDAMQAAMAAEMAAAEAEMQALAERSVAAAQARADATAMAEEAEALAALAEAEAARAAALVALEEARAAALRTTAEARAASLAALRESLTSADPDDQRLVLHDALVSDEPLLVRDALAFILAQKPELALEYRKFGSEDVYSVQILTIQEFDAATGTLKGQRSWNNGGREFAGTLLDGRLNLSDRDCKMTFGIDDEGVLAGDMQCRNRHEAIIKLN